MIERVEAIAARAVAVLQEAMDEADLEAARVEYLGRKSELMALLSSVGTLPPEERGPAGKAANAAKVAIAEAIEERMARLAQARLGDLGDREWIDLTFPAPVLARGHRHPLTGIQRELEGIFEALGYHVETGPEVETDWYNFEALNLPTGHAARDSQDSFYLGGDLLLRTHTSPVQIRTMERLKTPPIYAVAPGRVYRRDATDATHLACFMQFEGLAIDDGLSVADLKGTLQYMLQALYGASRTVRFRANFFPFTEPSFEFDVSCGVCGGSGCRSCGQEGWIEVGGCGMVHPQVLRNGGIDPSRHSGFAWGFGIERIAMLRYGVQDLRTFYENDLRFLELF